MPRRRTGAHAASRIDLPRQVDVPPVASAPPMATAPLASAPVTVPEAVAAPRLPEPAAAANAPAAASMTADALSRLQHQLSLLRLAMSADLAAAAGAAEAGRPDLAAEMLEGARGELAELPQCLGGPQTVAGLDRVAPLVGRDPGLPVSVAAWDATVPKPRSAGELTRPVPEGPPDRVPVPVNPAGLLGSRHRKSARALVGTVLAGALAAAGVFTFTPPARTPAPAPAALERAAMVRLAALRGLGAHHADPAEVLAAATALRSALLPLLSEARHDPAAARDALAILDAERSMIMLTDPTDAGQVLALTGPVLTELERLVPGSVPTSLLPPSGFATPSSILPSSGLGQLSITTTSGASDGGRTAGSASRRTHDGNPAGASRHSSSETNRGSAAGGNSSGDPSPTPSPSPSPSPSGGSGSQAPSGAPSTGSPSPLNPAALPTSKAHL